MRATTLLRLSLSLLLAAGLAACGSKRPPAVSTGERGAPTQVRPSASDSGSPLEGGPDVQPLPDDGMRGKDVWGGTASAEGGPLADVYFGYDSAELSDEARATLEQDARWLQAPPEARVTVEGHCDERGTVEYNLALGEQRARAVRDYLASLGVAGARLGGARHAQRAE